MKNFILKTIVILKNNYIKYSRFYILFFVSLFCFNRALADSEPNNVLEDANPFNIGQNVSGAVGPGDGQDWYVFTIPEDCSISITASATGFIPNLFTEVRIFLIDGCGGGAINDYLTPNEKTWNYGRVKAGTYWMLLLSQGNPVNLSYSFTVLTDYLNIVNDIEPNDIPSTSLPFYPNTTVTGHVGYNISCGFSDPLDYYKIHIPSSGDIDITAHFDTTLYESYPGTSSPEIVLRDSATNVIIASQNLSPPPIFDLHISYNNINPGTYYVLIHNPGNSGVRYACGYTLSNSFTPYSYLSTITANLKLFIQGFYLGENKMAAVSDPGLNPLLCDTIKLELHNSSPPYNLLYSATGILDVNGISQVVITSVLVNQECYFVVIHRNSLKTWSKTPVRLNTYTINYDFSTGASKAYGNNLTNLNDGNYALFSGDVDQNEIIDGTDLSDIENTTTLFMIGYKVNDITGDQIIESSDYCLVENNLGRISMKP